MCSETDQKDEIAKDGHSSEIGVIHHDNGDVIITQDKDGITFTPEQLKNFKAILLVDYSDVV